MLKRFALAMTQLRRRARRQGAIEFAAGVLRGGTWRLGRPGGQNIWASERAPIPSLFAWRSAREEFEVKDDGEAVAAFADKFTQSAS
jgi:hypothetical protein